MCNQMVMSEINNNNFIFILCKIHVNMITCALHESKYQPKITKILYNNGSIKISYIHSPKES